ncbi:1733_t:CDS:2, partial [Entrophospora sp. SA101]
PSIAGIMVCFLCQKTYLNIFIRNFHVFYYLIAGASNDEKSHLHLTTTDASQYRYLNLSKSTSKVYNNINADEANKFNELKQSLKSLGFHKKHVAQMFQLLAAILHLGNIQFSQDPNKQQDAAFVKNMDVLDLVADFLGVEPRALESALTYKTKLIKKEICTIFLDIEAASVQRDELAKALYSLLFSWIVEYINTKICREDFASFIGIVDLIGFQNASTNSLDQFCVNFANEKIYNFTLQQIFEVNNAEYVDQGIGDVVISEINQCWMLSTKKYSKHNSYTATAKSLNALPRFGIQHYTSQVTYDITGFMEKNLDNLSGDFVSLFRGNGEAPPSYNSFIVGLFTDKSVATESHPQNDNTIVAAQQSVKPMRSPSMRRKKSKKGSPITNENTTVDDVDDTSKKTVNCVTAQVQSALDELCETLYETTPLFIFCIRPNDTQLPNQIDSKVLLSQVKSLGLSEITNRLKINYTISLTHEEFLERYQPILDSMNINQSRDPKAKVEASCTIFGWDHIDMIVGNQKTYLSENAWRNLEDNLRNESSRISKQDFSEIGHHSLPQKSPDEQSYYSNDDRSYISEDESYQEETFSQYNETASVY